MLLVNLEGREVFEGDRGRESRLKAAGGLDGVRTELSVGLGIGGAWRGGGGSV